MLTRKNMHDFFCHHGGYLTEYFLVPYKLILNGKVRLGISRNRDFYDVTIIFQFFYSFLKTFLIFLIASSSCFFCS